MPQSRGHLLVRGVPGVERPELHTLDHRRILREEPSRLVVVLCASERRVLVKRAARASERSDGARHGKVKAHTGAMGEVQLDGAQDRERLVVEAGGLKPALGWRRAGPVAGGCLGC